MSTLNSYLSNAKGSGISPKQSYDMLINEFRKGNISYPRTDGENHSPLRVIRQMFIHPHVKDWIETKPTFELKDYNDEFYLLKGDPFILNEYLKLSTPATIINDYEKCCRLNYKVEENKYIGLEHYSFEQEMQNEKIELLEFSFEDIIKEAVAFELEVNEEELEINFYGVER